ncbi:hypothetical protein STIAU_7087 [Stigmatella aurantiaca DW4/3-1]|uniref:Uncharacterized protein n=1 Tax=Stigmatella aurantiaca (strain DW4/3-1) TaxID=378806 RepID=Q08PU3_STIAD|nr:hypothetical protein STIAU_7087 [Stigmatella aurantiaca DW4/3-1]
MPRAKCTSTASRFTKLRRTLGRLGLSTGVA